MRLANGSFSTRYQVLGAGTGTGTTVTSGSTTGTKGSYATLGTLSFPINSLNLSLGAAARTHRVDIAVNTGGADTIVIEDLYIEAVAGINNAFLLPISLPAGGVLKARSASSTAGSQTVTALATAYSSGAGQYPGVSRIKSCTDWTSASAVAFVNSVTETGTTPTAWTTACASLPARIIRLWVGPCHAGVAGTTSQSIVDLAVGSAGNEVQFASILQNNASSLVTFHEIPCDLPAGDRLSFRVTCSAAVSNSVVLPAWGAAA